MFWKIEKVPYDVLWTFRNKLNDKWNILDKVVMTQSLSSWIEKGEIWVIISKNDHYYVEGWWYRHISYGSYIKNDGWFILFESWKFWVVDEMFFKKYYWEFQEEFEALDESEQLQKQMEEKALEMQRLKEKADLAYEKSRKAQGLNYKELITKWII